MLSSLLPGPVAGASPVESNAYYSLFLFDDLSEAAGPALAQLARGLAHRARTPIIKVVNG